MWHNVEKKEMDGWRFFKTFFKGFTDTLLTRKNNKNIYNRDKIQLVLNNDLKY